MCQNISLFRTFFYSTLILISFSISCRKIDISNSVQQNSKQVEDKFFSLPANIDPSLKKVFDKIYKQNGQKHFIDKFVKAEGYALWDKAIVTTKSTTNSSNFKNTRSSSSKSASDSGSLILIPLVLQNATRVHGALACRVNGDSVSIKLLDGSKYKWYSAHPDSAGINGEQLSVLLMQVDHLTFRHNRFKITDSTVLDTANKYVKYIKINDTTISNSNGRINTSNAHWADFYYSVTAVFDEPDMCGCTGHCYPCPDGSTHPVTRVYIYSTPVWVDDDDNWYSGGPNTGGGGSSGGGTGGCFSNCDELPWVPVDGDPPALTDANGFYYTRINALNNILALSSEILLPCDQLYILKSLKPFYDTLRKFQPGADVDNRISQLASQVPSQTFFVQKIDDAGGTIVNADYFPLHISTFPTINGVQMSPIDFLEYFRLHMQSFITTSDLVMPYNYNGVDDTNLWSQHTTLSVPALVHFESPTLGFMGNATVIESNYTSDFTTNNYQWTFSTMYSPKDDGHPVSGNRRFGIFPDPQGGYIFYIGGIDRTNKAVIDALDQILNHVGLDHATDLWRNIILNVNNFVNDQSHGGSSNYYPFVDFVIHPNWEALKSFLQGHMSWIDFKALMGC